MVQLVVPIPDAKATQIAQSDKWTALSRLSTVFAGGVTTLILVPFVIWIAVTTEQSKNLLGEHSVSLSTLQATADKTEARSSSDHDLITVMRTQLDSAMVQIEKLWERPRAGDKAPTPQ